MMDRWTLRGRTVHCICRLVLGETGFRALARSINASSVFLDGYRVEMSKLPYTKCSEKCQLRISVRF